MPRCSCSSCGTAASDAKLVRRTERLERMLAGSPDVIAHMAGEGRQTYVSPALERLMGWPPERSLGR